MHKEILTSEQIKLLPLVSKFSKKFGLVGGTAIALHIGHRESIDFDLFSMESFDNKKIRQKISSQGQIAHVIRDELGQYTLIVNGVHMTFFHYPFPLDFSEPFEDIVHLPKLVTLAAMKLYTLGRRVKWKDYIDLYFILRDYHSLSDIIKESKKIFKNDFNEKIVREQLSYFKDINYSEQVIFKPGFEVDEKEIQEKLTAWSLE